MPRRAATVTQADIARAIRAIQAAGLPVSRIVVRPDGVIVETIPSKDQANQAEQAAEVANEDRVPFL